MLPTRCRYRKSPSGKRPRETLEHTLFGTHGYSSFAHRDIGRRNNFYSSLVGDSARGSAKALWLSNKVRTFVFDRLYAADCSFCILAAWNPR